MASLKARKTIKNLLKKGFIETDTHHHYYEFWHEGKMITRTYSSHSGEEINDYLISAMSKQCHMDKMFFIAFAKCDKSQEDYIKLLKSKKEISTP